jgi:iron complex outermembrane receptor protein
MLTITLPGGSWKPQVGAEYDYRSSELDANRATLPGYSTVGIHAGVQFATQTLRFYVKNLTNDRGLTGSQGYIPGLPYPVVITQPRTFGVIFSQKF